MKNYIEPETRKYRFWAMACQLSYFLGFLIPLPFASLLFPLIIWGLKKDESELVRENGKSIINFALTMWVYGVFFCLVIMFLSIPFFTNVDFSFKEIEHYIKYIDFDWREIRSNFIYPLLENLGPSLITLIPFTLVILFFSIIEMILVIYGSIKALNGEVYYYPLTFKFLNYTPTSYNPISNLQQERK